MLDFYEINRQHFLEAASGDDVQKSLQMFFILLKKASVLSRSLIKPQSHVAQYRMIVNDFTRQYARACDEFKLPVDIKTKSFYYSFILQSLNNLRSTEALPKGLTERYQLLFEPDKTNGRMEIEAATIGTLCALAGVNS